MELEEDQEIIPCSHKTAGDFCYVFAYAEDAQCLYYVSAYPEDAQYLCYVFAFAEDAQCLRYALTQNPPSMLR